MKAVIDGVTVFADPGLSSAEIKTVIEDLIQSWDWEGRSVDRVELICDQDRIHVCAYERTYSGLIWTKNQNDEE